MNDNLILILAVLVSAAIGGYLGMLFSKLKSKGEKSTLEERNNNLQLQLNDLKQLSEAEKNRIRRALQHAIGGIAWHSFQNRKRT